MNKCPKCGEEMEEGIIADRSIYDQPTGPEEWGAKMGGFLNSSLLNKKKVKTFRCQSCGYLESYAK